MKIALIILLSLCLLIPPACLFASAEEAVSMSYVCRDLSGSVRWRAESQIENIGPGIYVMTEKAEGIYSGFSGRVSWQARMEFESTQNNIRPIRLEKRVFDSFGKLIRLEKQEFDLAGASGVFTHAEPVRGVLRTKKFKFNKDVVNRLSLGLYARKFLESGKKSERLQMVTEEPKVYEIELKLMGRETKEIGGRKVTAYRLCVDPKLGLLDFVKVFFPRVCAWHSTAPGHQWLGYTGLEGGINSEKVEVLIEKL